MYRRIDESTEIEGLGNVFDFLVELNGVLFDEFQGFDDNDLELAISKKTYKVSYFNVDDREYNCSDKDVEEFISLKFNFLKDVQFERNDAYPDGTASYILFFELDSKKKKMQCLI